MILKKGPSRVSTLRVTYIDWPKFALAQLPFQLPSKSPSEVDSRSACRNGALWLFDAN
jgi:hypothetical protein